jgi:hypothetical protein
MLIKQKKTKNRYPNKIKGKGILDSLLSTLTKVATSNAAKEVAVNLSKTAATKLGEKAIEKIFPRKKNQLNKLTYLPLKQE